MARASAVLFKVALMVLLGGPKARRRENLRHDWARVVALLAIARRDRSARLRLAVREDSRAILIAEIGSLTIELGRIVNLPKESQKLFVIDLLRVKGYLDRFGMAGRVTADLTVRRVLDPASDVTRNDLENARNPPERVFDAPEAAGREGGSLRRHTLLERRTAAAGCILRHLEVRVGAKNVVDGLTAG